MLLLNRQSWIKTIFYGENLLDNFLIINWLKTKYIEDGSEWKFNQLRQLICVNIFHNSTNRPAIWEKNSTKSIFSIHLINLKKSYVGPAFNKPKIGMQAHLSSWQTFLLRVLVYKKEIPSNVNLNLIRNFCQIYLSDDSYPPLPLLNVYNKKLFHHQDSWPIFNKKEVISTWIMFKRVTFVCHNI